MTHCVFPATQSKSPKGGLEPSLSSFTPWKQSKIRTKSVFLSWSAAGWCPAADHILDRFEIFRSMVPWFNDSMVRWFICDCSAAQSSKCLAAAPVFLLGATRHFVLLSCKICAEIVVYRMLAVFLNGLNGKNSSRRIVRNIFSVYFFIQVSRLVIASILLSHRLLSR